MIEIDFNKIKPISIAIVSALPLYGETGVIYKMRGEEWIYYTGEWVQLITDIRGEE